MIQRKIFVDVTPTPDELAFEFANMDEEGQAMFFNELAAITKKWDKPFCFQLQMLVNNTALSDDGRAIMREIGNYVEYEKQ